MDIYDELNNYEYLFDDRIQIDEISHYTEKVDAVSNITSGEIWATYMESLDDKKEGRLVFDRLKEYLSKKDGEWCKALAKKIETDDKIEEFLAKKVTYVTCFGKGADSDHLWKNYAKNNGYKIVFDVEKFNESIEVVLGDDGSNKRKGIFKIRDIVYDKTKQEQIIESVIEALIKYRPDDTEMDLIIEKVMYIGGFFKMAEKYEKETEYRYLINAIPTFCEEIKDKVPVQDKSNGRVYTKITFDNSSIKYIECSNKARQDELLDKLDGKQYDFPITIRRENRENHL